MIAFLIAGTASGVGKTTTSLALMAAFRQRGLAVQPFKCGPDFLDGSHHTAICGRASRNLDTWMLDATVNRDIFERACQGADAAIVEGMMGLFDGVAGSGEQGSSAEIAKRLDLPVVLVLDASKSARSIAAIVKGFEIFDPEVRFAGVVLNGVAGEYHYRILKEAIASSCMSPILGWLPRNPEVAIAERHLGLHGALEETGQTNSEERLRSFASFAEAHLDLDRLMGQNYAIGRIPSSDCPKPPERQKRALVGVARDRAFSFYYEDNFDVLRECGAEIVEFSPLADSELPRELDAVYLGGGYPELYARTLSGNRTMLASLRAFAAAGKPVYAECGGMMYLAQTLTDLEGESFPMVDLLPLSVQMTEGLVHFGYAEVELLEDCLLGRRGTIMRGHSFHCSQATVTGTINSAYRVSYSLSATQEIEGYSKGSVLASYIHLHLRAHPGAARAFLEQAHRARKATLFSLEDRTR